MGAAVIRVRFRSRYSGRAPKARRSLARRIPPQPGKRERTLRERPIANRIARTACLIGMAALFAAQPAIAANVPDFSGSYTLKSAKGESLDEGEVWTLQVTQTESEIKIITAIDGHPSTEIFSLSGKETKCANADGTDATCSAQWKGKTLVLETVYTAHPTENGPNVEKHTRERLDLSSDHKTLTIRTDTKAPEFPALEMSAPTTETYTRN